MSKVIWLSSGVSQPPEVVRNHAEVQVVLQSDLTAEDLKNAKGLVTGNLLDQNDFLNRRADLEEFMDKGGRWFFNGHIVRELLGGLNIYRPMAAPKRQDFTQSRLAPHPIFDGIELAKVETNKGVAGFYGRGENPMPEGAIAITGFRQGTVAVDWVWKRPNGGLFFSHSGNDLGSMGLEWGLAPLLQERIINWAAGGDCLCA